MTRALNLQCRYKVVFDEKAYLYSFQTKNEIEYKVAFEIVDYLPISNLYSVSVVAVNSNHPPIDTDTQYAVREIIKHFFEDAEKVIIYLCSFDDKKEVKRYKKFNRWFENDDFNENLVKIDGVINETYFISIIYHRNNKLNTSISEIFRASIDNFNNK